MTDDLNKLYAKGLKDVIYHENASPEIIKQTWNSIDKDDNKAQQKITPVPHRPKLCI